MYAKMCVTYAWRFCQKIDVMISFNLATFASNKSSAVFWAYLDWHDVYLCAVSISLMFIVINFGLYIICILLRLKCISISCYYAWCCHRRRFCHHRHQQYPYFACSTLFSCVCKPWFNRVSILRQNQPTFDLRNGKRRDYVWPSSPSTRDLVMYKHIFSDGFFDHVKKKLRSCYSWLLAEFTDKSQGPHQTATIRRAIAMKLCVSLTWRL